MNCHECKEEIEQGSKFCQSCGTPILFSVLCSYCGSQNQANSPFCGDCGKPMKTETIQLTMPDSDNSAPIDEFAYLLSEEKIHTITSASKRIPYGCIAITFVDGVIRDVQDQDSVANDQPSVIGDFLSKVMNFANQMMGKQAHEVKTYIIANYQELPIISYIHPISIPGVLNASLRFDFWVEASKDLSEETARSLGLFFQRIMGGKISISISDFRLTAISAMQSLLTNHKDFDAESERDRNELLRILRKTTGITGKCSLVKGKSAERRFLDVSKITAGVLCKECAHEYKDKVKFCEYCGTNMESADWNGTSKYLQSASKDAIVLKLSFLNNSKDTIIPDDLVAESVINILSPSLLNITTEQLEVSSVYKDLNKNLNEVLALKFKGVLSDFKIIDIKTSEQEWVFKTELLIAEELRKVDAQQRGLAIDERAIDYSEAAFALAMRSARQKEDQQQQNLELRRQSLDREVAEHNLDTETKLRKEEIDYQANADRFNLEINKQMRERSFQQALDNEDRVEELKKVNHEMLLEESVAQHDIKLADLTGDAQSRSRRRDIADQIYEADENLRLKMKEKEDLSRIDDELQDRQHQRQIDKMRSMAAIEADMAKQDYDFETSKIAAMKGLDAAQILAMQATQLAKNGGTDAAASIVASIAQSQADAAATKIKDDLYQQMLQNKDDATKLALNAQQTAIDAIMKNSDSLSKIAGAASSSALEGYKEAAKVAQSTNEKSMDSMSKVATASAGRKTNREESANEVTHNCVQSSCDYVFTGKPKKYCPKCGANQFEEL